MTHETYAPGGWGRRYDHDWYDERPAPDPREALGPLFEALQAYDALRCKLELVGGELADLRAVAATLNREVLITGRFESKRVQLAQQSALRRAVRDVDYELRLDIRQLPSRFPVYYLCRTRSDYWSEYSLVVEDLYLSPGYPLPDERFVKLMREGKEEYFLRLSPFREDAARLADLADGRAAGTVDGLLYQVGRHVFQAAWHEDQRLAVMTASHFQLPELRRAIELLYLLLSGELCELRSAVDNPLLSFFEAVYRQPAIHRFLERLTSMDGGMLNDLPQRARTAYQQLLQAFSQFLATEVGPGRGQPATPLWRLIYANLNRLDRIAGELAEIRALRRAAGQLEATARGLIDEILSLPLSETERMEDTPSPDASRTAGVESRPPTLPRGSARRSGRGPAR